MVLNSRYQSNVQSANQTFLDYNKNPNRQVNKKIEYLYDRICSCQINRAANVADMDEQILSGLNALSTIVRSDDADAIISKITSILDMIEERDRRIRNSLAR